MTSSLRISVLMGGALASLLLTRSAFAIGWVGQDLRGLDCTGNEQAFGPFDYTSAEHRAQNLLIVEKYHFSRNVEMLVKPDTASYIWGDLDYVLRAFPNHHRALMSLINYATSGPGGTSRQPPSPTPPECYLQRALVFQPKDGTVSMLYGIYLYRLGRHDAAEEKFRQAVKLMPSSAEAQYNLGLVLVELKKYDDARAAARTAYKAGYPLDGLRKRLEAAGYAP